MRFWIDIENAAGVRQGDGPIASGLSWRSVRRLDRAGEFSFEMPATDLRKSLVTARRVARCYAVIDGAAMEIGAGTIDSISVRINDDGQPLLVVSGPDLLGELRRAVLDNHSTGRFPTFDQVNDAPYDMIYTYVNDKLGSDWGLADEAGSLIASGAAVTATDVYATFRNDSVLSGLIGVAEATGEHFRLGTGRVVEWVNSWTDSGIHAVYGAPSPVAVEGRAEMAQIMDIEWVEDSQDIVNRVFLYGSGEADTRLDLSATTEWPDGTAFAGSKPYYRTIDGILYFITTDISAASLDSTFNMLQDNASVTAYGPCEMALAFKNIAPISNTAADVTAAANQLLRSGFQWLRSRAYPQSSYRVALVGVQAVLKPGQTVQVTARRYVDGQAAVEIDQALNILEATVEVGVSGLRTTGLVVGTGERQPESDVGVVVAQMAEAVVSQAHQQTGPNTWTENFVDWLDGSNQAEFFFWLGEDIAQVQQIFIRFKVQPLRSTVRTNASEGSHTHTVSMNAHQHKVYAASSGAGSNRNLGIAGTGFLTYEDDVYGNIGNIGVPTTEVTGTTSQTSAAGLGHTHGITYGVFEQVSGNTYGHSGGASTLAQVKADLSLQVTGSGTNRMSGVAAVAGATGWYELDVTEWLVDAVTNRPTAAANSISITNIAADLTKTAQITMKLQVRCTIQSINYS